VLHNVLTRLSVDMGGWSKRGRDGTLRMNILIGILRKDLQEEFLWLPSPNTVAAPTGDTGDYYYSDRYLKWLLLLS
jgi:hypothetical protein